MAGDWIKMRVDLIDDPSVIAMASELNVDVFSVIGRLYKLWSWADRHSQKGKINRIKKKWVDDFLQLENFSNSMQNAGWLDVHTTYVRFPKFNRHNGLPAKQRAQDQRRKRENRRPESVRILSGSQQDKNRTRGEERRVEEIRVKDKTKTTAKAVGKSNLQPLFFGSKGHIQFDPDGTGRWIGVTEDDQTRWKTAYPKIDIGNELDRAVVWTSANIPGKGRKQNYGLFLARWMDRAQTAFDRQQNETEDPSRHRTGQDYQAGQVVEHGT